MFGQRAIEADRASESSSPTFHADHPTATFATVTVGREEDVVAQQARLADITIVPHPESGDDASSSDALHAVLFDSGRPVLIAPHRTPVHAWGTRVAVAWNGTGEGCRRGPGGIAVVAGMPRPCAS